MGAPDIIFQLRNKGYSIYADGGFLEISPADDLDPAIVEQLKRNKQEILTQLQKEAQAEIRRERALQMLNQDSAAQRVVVTDAETDPKNIILTVAIRSVASFEMLVSKASYNPFGILELIERHGCEATH